MRRHLTTPAVGGLNHDTGLGRKRANRAAHERSSTMGSMYWCFGWRQPKTHQYTAVSATERGVFHGLAQLPNSDGFEPRTYASCLVCRCVAFPHA